MGTAVAVTRHAGSANRFFDRSRHAGDVKLPRDLSGRELTQALLRVGSAVRRQTGSHRRLTTNENGEHPSTLRDHDPLRIGTWSAILKDVAEHQDLARDEVLERFFAWNVERNGRESSSADFFSPILFPAQLPSKRNGSLSLSV